MLVVGYITSTDDHRNSKLIEAGAGIVSVASSALRAPTTSTTFASPLYSLFSITIFLPICQGPAEQARHRLSTRPLGGSPPQLCRPKLALLSRAFQGNGLSGLFAGSRLVRASSS